MLIYCVPWDELILTLFASLFYLTMHSVSYYHSVYYCAASDGQTLTLLANLQHLPTESLFQDRAAS